MSLRILVALLGLVALPVAAQETSDSPADSLRSYDLGEVVVGSGPEERAESVTRQRIRLAAVDRLDAVAVDAAVRLIPAAHVQTNSRGETLVYLRAAGERQTALFFDGALLNVPWDNRIDLGLVPSSVVGGITVAKGVPSVLWGTNVLGGAVNIVSRGLQGEGSVTEATLQGGAPRSGQVTATHLGRRGRWSYVTSGGYAEHQGFAVPDDLAAAGLRFSQRSERVRTNTDTRLANAFGRVAYWFDTDSRVGLALLHLDGAKGVAPEGHLDPAVDRVRFWRYPDWRLSTLILSADIGLGAATRLRGATWGSAFAQTITSYEGADYEALVGEQANGDRTLGSRAILEHRLEPFTLRFGLNALTSTHRQQDAEDGETTPELTFRQGLYSVGLEGETRTLGRLTLTAGVSMDALTTPETGDKPDRDGFADWGATGGATFSLGERWALHGALGRKTRFPTPRELFGEALDRFALNPDLRPESSVLAEVGAQRNGERWSGEATVFARRTGDTIDQERLEDGRRRRVNLGGSRVLGIEVAGVTRIGRVRFDGHLTVMDVRGYEEGGATTRLSEKPEAIGRLAVTVNPGRGFNVAVEGVYRGVSYAPTDAGFARLAPALIQNVRAGYRVFVRGVAGEVFGRVENVTDAVVLPQLGLPAPGREFRLGLKLAL